MKSTHVLIPSALISLMLGACAPNGENRPKVTVNANPNLPAKANAGQPSGKPDGSQQGGTPAAPADAAGSPAISAAGNTRTPAPQPQPHGQAAQSPIPASISTLKPGKYLLSRVVVTSTLGSGGERSSITLDHQLKTPGVIDEGTVDADVKISGEGTTSQRQTTFALNLAKQLEVSASNGDNPAKLTLDAGFSWNALARSESGSPKLINATIGKANSQLIDMARFTKDANDKESDLIVPEINDFLLKVESLAGQPVLTMIQIRESGEKTTYTAFYQAQN